MFIPVFIHRFRDKFQSFLCTYPLLIYFKKEYSFSFYIFFLGNFSVLI
jgi:hypothetical protein